MLRAVIWDFDGTVCDTYPAIAQAVNTALAHFGAQATLARVIDLVSISLERCMRTLAEDFALPYDQLDAVFTQPISTSGPPTNHPFQACAICANDLPTQVSIII